MPKWPGDRIIIITYSNFRLAQLGISLKPESIPNLINLYLPSPRFLRVLHSPCSTICGHFISSPVSKYYYVFICRLRLMLWTSWALPAAKMFAPVNDYYWYCYIFQYSLTISGHPLGIYISHRYVVCLFYTTPSPQWWPMRWPSKGSSTWPTTPTSVSESEKNTFRLPPGRHYITHGRTLDWTMNWSYPTASHCLPTWQQRRDRDLASPFASRPHPCA